MLFVLLLGYSCKKEEKAQAPPPSPTPTATGYTSADSAISGDWLLDLTEVYNNGSLIQSTPHSDPVNCHLDLQIVESTLTPGNTDSWKNCIEGLNCTNYTLQWRLSSGKLDINNLLRTIVSQTSTNLVLLQGSISSGGGTAIKYYFHK
jgi:hypothetical protein